MFSAVIALTGAPAARADLQFSVQPVAASPGDVNDTLEVDATNTGSSVVDLAAFAFEINTLSSDIEFQQSTTATVLAPYVFFAGNSLVDTYFGGVNSIDGPGQTLDVSDVVLTPNTFADIAAGATVGLGEISFNVAPDAVDGLDAVDLNPAQTSASDQFGYAIPLDFSNGGITVTTVPEPSGALTLLVIAVAGFLMAKRFPGQWAITSEKAKRRR
jgi:hypothetical protein